MVHILPIISFIASLKYIIIIHITIFNVFLYFVAVILKWSITIAELNFDTFYRYLEYIQFGVPKFSLKVYTSKRSWNKLKLGGGR